MADARSAIVGELDKILQSSSRRDFLRLAGIGGMGIFFPAVITACDSQLTGITGTGTPPTASATLDFSTNVGVLNYAYALEQLEAAFYTQVIATPYTGMSTAEMAALTGIRDHEVIHRDFFKAAITSGRISDSVPVTFKSVDFTSRSSVLGTAKVFEDLGVSAYNGAGHYLSNDTAGATYLTFAGKIVSVEARHAALIRDLLNPGSTDFAGNDVVDANGLDVVRLPGEVLSSTNAGAFITAQVTIKNA